MINVHVKRTLGSIFIISIFQVIFVIIGLMNYFFTFLFINAFIVAAFIFITNDNKFAIDIIS